MSHNWGLIMRISTMSKLAAFSAGVAFASYVAILASIQRKLVFNPTNEEPFCPLLLNHKVSSIFLPIAQNECVTAHYYVPKNVDCFDVVVYLPGRSEDSRWTCQAVNMIDEDLGFVSINYRGFGDSDGRPSEKDVVQDTCTLLNMLKKDKRIKKIHILGRSLGTGVAIQAQSLTDAGSSLILVTPYDSIVEIAKKKFPLAPVSWILQHRFESIKYCKSIGQKTLVVLAQEDDVVPWERSARLMENWSSKFYSTVIPNSDHCTIVHLEDFWKKVCVFIKHASS